MSSIKKVVLAYSGGLDTSVAVRWIADTYRCEVACFCADIGQGEDEDLDAARQKALGVGAKTAIVRDLKLACVRDYAWPALPTGPRYENHDPMGTSLPRPGHAHALCAT